jgi:hypothetical protein
MANRGRPKKGAWISTAAMADELGWSVQFLLKHRNDRFESRTHWRMLDPHAKRVTYRWNRLEVLKKLENEPQSS